MQTAVIVFPGSNCDRDMAVALRHATGREPHMVWHKETALPSGVDLVALPGGFSYGDYLRCGAIAARSPIMAAVRAHAERGGMALGVCNGFQVLCETGLLPGVLMRNATLKFVCRDVAMSVSESQSPFTRGYEAGQRIHIPVAHHDGFYVADEATLERVEREDRVAFRYEEPVNGSLNRIAGLLSSNRRVLGMMPHPERAFEPAHGGTDGRALFMGLVDELETA